MFGYMKRALTVTIILAALLISRGFALAASLGTPEGWESGELKTVQLEAVSGNQGTWFERTYKTATGASITATLMEGKGASWHNVPLAPPPRDQGGLFGGEIYRKFTTYGREAVIERRPFMGTVLAMKADGATLTLECRDSAILDDELVRYADELLKDG
ncbi:MAG: hypothetical protein LBT31_09810 [Synergistaceae bacterium]|nr:hypothetical protein [Synergistaceae bacterium]